MTTVVVPLRLPRAQPRAQRRLERLLRTLPAGWRVLVVDDTRAGAVAAATARTVARFAPRARHLRHAETAAGPFSIGRLRDAGARAAPDGPVLFHDLDFFAPPAVYRRLDAALEGPMADELAAGGFLCVPVAFLGRLGTAVAARADDARWAALAAPWAQRLGLVDRFVLASSALVLERRTLLAHGGHSAAFGGHGAEDFELMHRLAAARPRGPKPRDYHVDYGSRDAERGGFRAYFARYAAPFIATGLHLAHAWHPPRREDPRYYAQRRANFARLEALLRQAPVRAGSAAFLDVVGDEQQHRPEYDQEAGGRQ